MRGVAFLASDGSLGHRSDDFLRENPSFFQDNQYTILHVWRINTEDPTSCRWLLAQLSRLQLKTPDVRGFCKSVGIDIDSLKAR